MDTKESTTDVPVEADDSMTDVPVEAEDDMTDVPVEVEVEDDQKESVTATGEEDVSASNEEEGNTAAVEEEQNESSEVALDNDMESVATKEVEDNEQNPPVRHEALYFKGNLANNQDLCFIFHVSNGPGCSASN